VLTADDLSKWRPEVEVSGQSLAEYSGLVLLICRPVTMSHNQRAAPLEANEAL